MAEEEQQEAPKKKKGLIKWIVLALLILGLAGGGYFAYVTFFASPSGEKAGEAAAPAPESVKGYKDLVTLPTFVVNLADPLGRRYLKLGMDVEVVDLKTVNELKQNESRVRDAVILLLSSKTYNDIGTTEGQILLRKEIVERLNQVLGGPKVLRVYFTEMVVQ
ncbi:flagellar basal body-associated protein FliL [Alkalidesulfovibrio alkalitolerans DSM 16529]|jgi:flagellar FliL protein|uniref:Flagellar protein FliL n=1 Tax=Alkalidesulfovibrio alkalitolerans DSM 16529 TaxID=1121439 RepID=S7TCX4_9BACT|nr:flagellar basal body-associated FliL family protein [Alkalidesulfovibrio alkalitolerans]EPR34506.1 flagellar basal body-associated protein FliL [Alkalidesulfovibrio alkalitolerans DSM 16529]